MPLDQISSKRFGQTYFSTLSPLFHVANSMKIKGYTAKL
ncbi:hypothetical protein C2W64_03736 [Brevibacillus laterosporus]|nr:hypothetical protein C2W64_03736 [Brevibacillus laterosporus]